ncbi:MAG: hypothetical protein ACKVWV_18070 [Planctomycetota bacterium]
MRQQSSRLVVTTSVVASAHRAHVVDATGSVLVERSIDVDRTTARLLP